MKSKNKTTYKLSTAFIFFLSFLICSLSCKGQLKAHYNIGVVTDSLTDEPLEAVSIFFKEKNEGVITKENGIFLFPSLNPLTIKVTTLGYGSKTIKLNHQVSDTLFIRLAQAPLVLDDLVVGKKKNKYSKKNNPAVDLIKRVRSDSFKFNSFDTAFYSYDKYEKILLAGNDVSINGRTENHNKYNKFRQYLDTAPWTGKAILDLALFEKTSSRIMADQKKLDKEITTGSQSFGIAEMLPFDNIREMFSDVLREVDIYGNDINLMQNRFVSPLSVIGTDFYMYEITDTVFVSGEFCTELSFAPKTPETFGFNGKIFIPVSDSLKYIKRVSMRIPKAINLNYIQNIFLSQNYQKDSLGKVHKTLDDISVELQIVKSTPPLYASRQTRLNNFSFNKRKDLEEYYSFIGNEYILEKSDKKNNEYWICHRSIPLSSAEINLIGMPSTLRQNKIMFWGEKILRIVFNGYVGTLPHNSKINIGPVNTFISYNEPEGLRLKLGGITTAGLSDHFFIRGYGAYGFKDNKWKYGAEVEYSFIKKKNHSREFPMNGIRASYTYDINQIGVRYLYSNADNIILSLKRMSNNLISYQRTGRLEYNLELDNHLSFNIGYIYQTQFDSPWVKFTNGKGETKNHFNTGGLFATLRWAPGEKFVQTVSNRRPINMDAPIFTISQEYGPKKVFGTDFTMNKTEISFLKRFWFSAFGYTNVLLKAGKIWSQVPFPMLLWQNANLSYTIQQETFALLNPMEFAVDQFISWDMEYFVNGAILNRIPFIKKMKLREIVLFKGFYGSLTKRNNPEYNLNLYEFPAKSETYIMKKTPYMEIGVGLDNIFTVLRVDYIWRLTYRDHPHIDRGGVRVSLHLSF